MRASTAFFAGAGTVIAAIVGGIGGGLLFADIISPKSPKQEMTRLEQRMSSQPIQVKADPSESAPNPAASPSSTTVAVSAVPMPVPAQIEAKAPPAATPPAVTPAATIAATQSTVDAAAQKKATTPDDAFARAKEVDVKRAATEKRRSERRQQWSEKRRYQRREDPDQELREVEARVREQTETRPIFASEPAHNEMPRIRLFDRD